MGMVEEEAAVTVVAEAAAAAAAAVAAAAAAAVAVAVAEAEAAVEAEWGMVEEAATAAEWATAAAAERAPLQRPASPRAMRNFQPRKPIKRLTKPVSAHRAERSAHNEIRNVREGPHRNKCYKIAERSKRLARSKHAVSSLVHENSVDDWPRDRARGNRRGEHGRWMQ
jgi:hypothetical protein